MATIGTFQSNTSSSTTCLLEWTSLSATQIRINATYKLGSATGLGTGNSRNLEAYIYDSNGTLIASGSVEVKSTSTTWNSSGTYYGEITLNIPYRSGVTLLATAKTVIGAYTTGVNSCRWDAAAGTNYPSQASISWPVYNTAPYWGSATAVLNLSGTIPENTSSLSVTWGAAADDQNDTIYYDVYRVSSLGTTMVAAGLTTRSFTDNIGAGNQGAWYEYHIYCHDGSMWAVSPDHIVSNRVTKNVFTKATLASTASVDYNSTVIPLTWSGAANTNGNGTFTYLLSSSQITIRNANVPATGSSYSLPIYRTGTAPSSPYVNFDDIKTLLGPSQYIGTINIVLTTTNAYGSADTSIKGIPANIQMDPAAFTVNAPTGTLTIAGSAYFIPDRLAIGLSWTASSDLLGGSITYDVEASLSGGAYEMIKTGLTGTSTSLTFAQVSAATSCTLRVVAKTSYGKTRTVARSAISLHYYLPPTITITGITRLETSVNVTATVGFRSSITGANTVTSASFVGKSGSSTALTPGTSLSITEMLTAIQTYTMTITVQDAGGVGVGTTATSVSLVVPKYAPMLSVLEKGVGINAVNDGAGNYIAKIAGKVNSVPDQNGYQGYFANGHELPKRLTVSANKSTAGWYRIFSWSAGDASTGQLAGGAVARIVLNRSYSYNNNESQTIEFNGAYGTSAFRCIGCKVNTQLITKIRHVKSTNSLSGFIEFFYSGPSSNGLYANLNLMEDGALLTWAAVAFTSVAETPADGTVITTYTLPLDPALERFRVGDLYETTNSANPGTYLGGTWAAFGAGRVTVGFDSGQTEFNTVEKTGGEKAHVLTVNELASHNHDIYNGTTEVYGFSRNTSASDTSLAVTGSACASGTMVKESYDTIDYRGQNAAHNNIQPYIVVYRWRRTA